MVIFILLILAVGFWFMSPTSRKVFACVLFGSVIYVMSISPHFFGSGMKAGDIGIVWSLMKLVPAVFVLCVVLGVVRKQSGAALYPVRRQMILRFVMKWGGVYFAISLLVRFIAFLGGDAGMGFAIMNLFGAYIFIGVVGFWWVIKYRRGAARVLGQGGVSSTDSDAFTRLKSTWEENNGGR